MRLLGKGKQTTNSKGDISEAAIIARFLQQGYVVLTVYGGINGMIWSSRTRTANAGACNVKRLE